MKEAFTAYLTKHGFVEKTRQRMQYCANHYQKWLTDINLTIEETTYKDLLNYIGHLQESKSKQVTNEHLRAVSLYNRHLQIPDKLCISCNPNARTTGSENINLSKPHNRNDFFLHLKKTSIEKEKE